MFLFFNYSFCDFLEWIFDTFNRLFYFLDIVFIFEATEIIKGTNIGRLTKLCTLYETLCGPYKIEYFDTNSLRNVLLIGCGFDNYYCRQESVMHKPIIHNDYKMYHLTFLLTQLSQFTIKKIVTRLLSSILNRLML